MPKNYPLNSLRAFEVAARLLSFSKAADELNVTPAAISHQVKKLEDYLGVSLFRRLPRGILLSEAGQILWQDLQEVFARLDKVMDKAQSAGALGPLTISVAPVFASKWLVPRLDTFNKTYPDIDVRLMSSVSLVDFQAEGFDAAIRFGKGEYRGLCADLLFDESVTPMCSPHLLAGETACKTPEDILSFTLLHNDSLQQSPGAPDWGDWMAAAGVKDGNHKRGLRFGQPDHALQAAVDGAGFVLGWRRMAANDLATGRLVAPFDLTLPLGNAFYLVYPQAFAERQTIRSFKKWLLAETSLWQHGQ